MKTRMAIKYKDYYKILEVSRTASEQEIKKSYRKLARQYHPDVAQFKKGAEDRFKEINEAYEVLGNPARRRQYDGLGHSWKSGADGAKSKGSYNEFRNGKSYTSSRVDNDRDSDFSFGSDSAFSDFFEEIFGSRGYTSDSRGEKTSFNEDVGMAERGADIVSHIYIPLEEISKGSVRSVAANRKVKCPVCDEKGVVNGLPCNECAGTGFVKKSHTYNVKIPAGVTVGQKLRIAGAGDAGVNGGMPGDLFLTILFQQHLDFEIDGNDLIYVVEITPAEAVLGAKLIIPTLKDEVNIKIPPGTQHGTKLRIRGRGLPGSNGTAGDLIVEADIHIPENPSEAEKRLWTQLSQLNQAD